MQKKVYDNAVSNLITRIPSKVTTTKAQQTFDLIERLLRDVAPVIYKNDNFLGKILPFLKYISLGKLVIKFIEGVIEIWKGEDIK
jgi:hypothetical protein